MASKSKAQQICQQRTHQRPNDRDQTAFQDHLLGDPLPLHLPAQVLKQPSGQTALIKYSLSPHFLLIKDMYNCPSEPVISMRSPAEPAALLAFWPRASELPAWPFPPQKLNWGRALCIFSAVGRPPYPASWIPHLRDPRDSSYSKPSLLFNGEEIRG